jgi:hypothetical protein
MQNGIKAEENKFKSLKIRKLSKKYRFLNLAS